MIQLKDNIQVTIFIAIAITGIASCARMAAEPEMKLSGRFYEDSMGEFGTMPVYFLVFNEPCFIQRIVINTKRPVKNIDIYVRVEPEKWELVKQFKKPIEAATRINIAMRGDAIRVRPKSITVASSYWGYDGEGYIQGLEAFGSPRR